MRKIPFFLVTGFLGSGKTTFLKKILNNHGNQKIAIIQNEFAPINVDSIELRRESGQFEILEINNGSVFCVCLLSDFVSSLESFLKNYEPDIIILEASGLSDPIAIAEILNNELVKNQLFLAKIWTIVDCSRFIRQVSLITPLQHQVRIADTVIINKTDLADKSEVDIVTKEVAALNPFAEILESQFCQIDNHSINLEFSPMPVSIRRKEENIDFGVSKRPNIEVGVLKTSKSIPVDRFEKFIEYQIKNTIRIKGFAKLSNNQIIAVQSSFDQFTLKEVINYSEPTEIIFMGEGISITDISKQFRELVEK